MAKYLIEGGVKLEGTVNISGNKNSVLPCLAACLLTHEVVTLKNVPKIADVDTLIEILLALGAKVETGDHEVTVQAQEIKSHKLPQELVSKLRASVLLIGPLLARVGKVDFSHPGGDIIGKRSIDAHISGLKKSGFKFKVSDREYEGRRDGNENRDINVFLDEPSVTATENMIMALSLGKGKVVLKNCAQEPHIVDLCSLLNLMGAEISGAGTSTIQIEKVLQLKGAEFKIGPDYIELGTYAAAAALTHGKVKLIGCGLNELEPAIVPLEKMGVVFEENGENALTVWAKEIKSIPRLHVRPWPGFPTDLMSIFIVLATQGRGVSLLHDWMYENRMFFVDKLISMGANITIADPHRVLVYGPTRLFGREVESPDIRAGMALVLAALIAKGTSIINKAELIERGYEDVVGNLSRLGANIKRID